MTKSASKLASDPAQNYIEVGDVTGFSAEMDNILCKCETFLPASRASTE